LTIPAWFEPTALRPRFSLRGVHQQAVLAHRRSLRSLRTNQRHHRKSTAPASLAYVQSMERTVIGRLPCLAPYQAPLPDRRSRHLGFRALGAPSRALSTATNEAVRRLVG